jgi:hypothetical protein
MAVIPTAQFHDRVKRIGSLQIVSTFSRLVCMKNANCSILINTDIGVFIPRRLHVTVLTFRNHASYI